MNEGKPSGHRIIIISDGTGETAAQITKAAMVQFSNHDVFFTRYKNVRNENQIQAIVEEAESNHDLVVYTIVSPSLRAYLASNARSRNIPCVDLLGPILIGLGNYFGYAPKAIAGLLHDVNENYFKRIEAMEYTIAHDDGRDLTGLERADIVILGISRTSKTPLSMYLSHQGWKVANIPMIHGFELAKEIYEIDQKKIVGLTIDSGYLSTIRRARLERLGQERGGEYADPEKVLEEIEFADQIFKNNRKWVVFNVSGKALEETASEIIRLMESRGLTPISEPLKVSPVPALAAQASTQTLNAGSKSSTTSAMPKKIKVSALNPHSPVMKQKKAK